MLKIEEVNTSSQIKLVRELFLEYSNYLGIDLEFQNFKEEIKSLPGEYASPTGCILLGYYNDNLAGCVAMREYSNSICEMKRLFVRPKFRGKGLGRALSIEIIKCAKLKFNYTYMRLDTLAFMKEAINIYISLGFNEIESYRYNPFEGARFFELKLELNNLY